MKTLLFFGLMVSVEQNLVIEGIGARLRRKRGRIHLRIGIDGGAEQGSLHEAAAEGRGNGGAVRVAIEGAEAREGRTMFLQQARRQPT